MGVEIERKFLVNKRLLKNQSLGPGERITQGYLATGPAVRIRLVYRCQTHKYGFITVKGPGLMKRAEFEYVIPYEDARSLLKLCKTTIEKVRYKTCVDGHIWEVDKFLGPLKGLWLAEIELPTQRARFKTPVWAEQEVTEDVRYTNVALSKRRKSPA